MNLFHEMLAAVHRALEALQRDGVLPGEIDLGRIGVEPPRDPAHGDIATNAAMVLAKAARTNPMVIAERLAGLLRAHPDVASARAARPGFVNLRLEDAVWRRQVRIAIEQGAAYGTADLGGGEPVNVEYCSANPTGPLHVGHGRGTVFGDALANLLDRMGWRVTREYYVNDGGGQIEALARSVRHRYLEALGLPVGEVPEGLYPGDYLVPVGRDLAARHGDRFRDAPEDSWLPVFRDAGVAAMMDLVRGDLLALGARFDVFSSERALIEAGRIEEALALLAARDLLYEGTLPPPKGQPDADWEPVPQLLFRATLYGDDSDRPLKRSSGDWTYFAADLAYHLDKYRRGFRRQIDVWGADHGGYVKRMQAAVAALTGRRATLDVRLCQLVNLLDGGQPLKMSKRAGRIVTLRDVIDEVGRDVVRFIMLTRKNDAPLDFDLQKVTEQSRDNPVFYVQYAHARIRSVFRHAGPELVEGLAAVDLEPLEAPEELALIRQMALWPRLLEQAALAAEPHRVAFYLYELAAAFHGLWTQGKDQSELRFLLRDDPALTRARLAMLEAVRTVIASGLDVMGVVPVEDMH
jgi:arginyl-tRNA synthetase